MSAQHTPGPWTWGEDHPQNACVSVYAPADRGDYGIANLYSAPTDDAGQDENGVWGDHPERRANARLIAAAPDLLAALVHAREYIAMSAPDWHIRTQEMLATIDAAIAKARGQQ